MSCTGDTKCQLKDSKIHLLDHWALRGGRSSRRLHANPTTLAVSWTCRGAIFQSGTNGMQETKNWACVFDLVPQDDDVDRRKQRRKATGRKPMNFTYEKKQTKAKDEIKHCNIGAVILPCLDVLQNMQKLHRNDTQMHAISSLRSHWACGTNTRVEQLQCIESA